MVFATRRVFFTIEELSTRTERKSKSSPLPYNTQTLESIQKKNSRAGALAISHLRVLDECSIVQRMSQVLEAKSGQGLLRSNWKKLVSSMTFARDSRLLSEREVVPPSPFLLSCLYSLHGGNEWS